MNVKTEIKDATVLDLRVPTSDTLLGSDPFHKKPNNSVVILNLETDAGVTGMSVTYTIGAGNDWVAYAIKDLCRLLINARIESFINDPGAFFKTLIDHHQLRWLADGVFRMAVGGVVNAMWDLWAKVEQKPLWKLLVDLPPEKVVQCIDWRHLTDALTPDEAHQMLKIPWEKRSAREAQLRQCGPRAYSTAGWLGLTDRQIIETIDRMKSIGIKGFKMKVGQNLPHDKERLSFIRSVIGDDSSLMLDANQIWGVDEAIEYMEHLVAFHPLWIEEPTARDDVLGHIKIARALSKYNIGVAAGEQIPSPVIFKQMLASGALSYCQIDATRLGGVNDIMAVILMAAKYNVPVCPHAGGIGLCNMVQHYVFWDQICVAAHSNTQVVEYVDFLQEDVFIDPVVIDKGGYAPPASAGWGLEMKTDFMGKHIYPTGSVWVGREASGGVLFLA